MGCLIKVMDEEFEVNLKLIVDTPNSMTFGDTYEGLENIWYKFESDEDGNISILANSDGYEHLARFFLKMARTNKKDGYHSHHPLEFLSEEFYPELTIEYTENFDKE